MSLPDFGSSDQQSDANTIGPLTHHPMTEKGMNQEFEYDKLSYEPFEIRLLSFEPVENLKSPISLKVSKCLLSSSPKYLALSYTWDRPSEDFPEIWDDPSCTESIVVNGRSFSVRMNLYTALFQLRAGWPQNTAWWIDAICINQLNVVERNMVVSQMAKIYSSSDHTIAWLGEQDMQTSSAFNHISEMATAWNERSDEMQDLRLPKAREAEYLKLLEKEFAEDTAGSWEAVANLWRRSWWRRAWIVQEISLARDAIAVCGNQILKWSNLRDNVKLVVQHAIYLPHLEHHLQRKASQLVGLFFRTYYPYRDLDSIIGTFDNIPAPERRLELLPLMACIRRTQCKDPRDKLYSVLAMSHNTLAIKVDYSLPVEETYTDLARAVILKSQSLNILSYCSPDPGSVAVPSWVPDWTAPIHNLFSRLPQHGISPSGLQNIQEEPFYSMVPGPRLSVRFIDGGRTLVTPALAFEQVVFISNTTGRKPHSELFLDRSWLREWAEFQSRKPLDTPWIQRNGWQYATTFDDDQFKIPTYVPTKERLLDAYLRTVCAEAIFDKKTTVEVPLPRSAGSVAEMDLSFDSVALKWEGRRLAVSTGGILILVPDVTEPGDWLNIIPGGEIPVMLRKFEDKYRLIGQCYAHGFMGSEPWIRMDLQDGAQIAEICII